MNKVYIIIWLQSNGYELSRSTYCNIDRVQKVIDNSPDWDFELVVCNDNQMIWEAR